jgi:TetR/AcrR family transcriptional repressor of nem operon
MTTGEYEERFRAPAQSLHETFSDMHGPKWMRRRRRRVWIAAAMLGLITAAMETTSHRTTDMDAGEGRRHCRLTYDGLRIAAAASLTALAGCGRGTGATLYNAFGDKRSLYRQAFLHYLEQTVRDRVARLEKLRPAVAIRAFFDEIIERSVDDEQRRGCMLVNAALELAPYDPEFRKLVVEEMMFIAAFFRRCVAAGQKNGSIIKTRPADEAAKLLLSVLMGIRVLARTRPERDARRFV